MSHMGMVGAAALRIISRISLECDAQEILYV